MARKIREPLEMENGIKVRSMNELRGNFSIKKIIEHINSGKLLTWLRERYYTDEAELIEKLDMNSKSLAAELAEIFRVSPLPDETPVPDGLEISRKLGLLKKYGIEDSSFSDVINLIAFDQDDLYDLLDRGTDTIYLCGDKFEIPVSRGGVHYIGINEPEIFSCSKNAADPRTRGITAEGVRTDGSLRLLKEKEPTDSVWKYEGSYLYSALSPKSKKASEKCFERLSDSLCGIDCFSHDYNQELKKRLRYIIGIADNFIGEL